MRTFHMTWMAFFTCFFGWFAIAPLMPIVRAEFSLTQAQIADTVIASVLVTIFVRLFMGWLCDRFGARKTYTGLLLLGSLPVMGIGFSYDFQSFLFFRLAIGIVGASFVITQYHTSVMFAPNCVGAANATTAGWGNLGGGVTQIAMPLILAAMMSLGVDDYWAWRLAMTIPGVFMILMGAAYFFLTRDFPEGNIQDLAAGGVAMRTEHSVSTFIEAAKDYRAWILFVLYGACFGVELTVNNVAALYFTDTFSLSLKTAGLIAGLFGLMNLFARSLGGILSDRLAQSGGLRARTGYLSCVLFLEGVFLMLFSQMETLPSAITGLIVFSLFVQMAEGAVYSVVPFIRPRSLGAVSGIVGAGGNAGAVLIGFMFRSEAMDYARIFLILGAAVSLVSLSAFLIKPVACCAEALNERKPVRA